MTDRELLELAAKAIGREIHHWSTILPGPMLTDPATGECSHYWNPLDEDGEALRLAVKLASLGHTLNIYLYQDELTVFGPGESFLCRYANDHYAATRRAIVRAAAAIGGPHA